MRQHCIRANHEANESRHAQTKSLTTGCKNVKTLRRKPDLYYFKSLLVTRLWDIILTSLLPSIQSCPSKFWAWSCIASNLDEGWRGITSTRLSAGHLNQMYRVSSIFVTSFSAWNVSFSIFLRIWRPIYLINSVDKTKSLHFTPTPTQLPLSFTVSLNSSQFPYKWTLRAHPLVL